MAVAVFPDPQSMPGPSSRQRAVTPVENPIALFRRFASGESDRPVTPQVAAEVVAHIDGLIEGIYAREKENHSLLNALLAVEMATRDTEKV